MLKVELSAVKLWVLVEFNCLASRDYDSRSLQVVMALRSRVFRIIAICKKMLVIIVFNKLSYVTLCIVKCTYCLWL